ncbi:MAG: Uma2 family endonuclease [Planctomycetaceae bacterium]
MTTTFATVADLQERLGGIPTSRILLNPPPGAATVDDVIAAEREDRICELIDGVLVEKTMGWFESRIAVALITILEEFLDEHDLGLVLGADGTLRILPKQVRVPDVCFISWERFPNRRLPKQTPIPNLVPDLAVEVLSDGNTPKEMDRKLRDYFKAGVRLVWYIDPPTRTAEAYTSLDDVKRISARGTLDGGDVLPGFRLSLKKLFSRAERSRRR